MIVTQQVTGTHASVDAKKKTLNALLATIMTRTLISVNVYLKSALLAWSGIPRHANAKTNFRTVQKSME